MLCDLTGSTRDETHGRHMPFFCSRPGACVGGIVISSNCAQALGKSLTPRAFHVLRIRGQGMPSLRCSQCTFQYGVHSIGPLLKPNSAKTSATNEPITPFSACPRDFLPKTAVYAYPRPPWGRPKGKASTHLQH